MHSRTGHGWRVASIVVATLLALTLSPALVASARASPSPSSTWEAPPTSWALGGETELGVALTVNDVSFTLGSIAGADIIFSATNTSVNVTELTLNRTVVASVGEAFFAPNAQWIYAYRLVEYDAAYANVTDAATVTLGNGQHVPALGVLNESTVSEVSLQVVLVGTINNHTIKDSLTVVGFERTAVSFSPALGLFPLNLSWATFWRSSALATGAAAWNITWSSVNQGWNGVTSNRNGSISGTWSRAAEVCLFGQASGWYSGWNDQVNRAGVLLSVTGPFDLYSGFLFYPQAFDLWSNFPCAISAFGLGSSWIGSETIFLTPGRLWPWSLSAESLTMGGWAPYGWFLQAPTSFPVGFGLGAWATPMPLMTVWLQPETPMAAEDQAQALEQSVGGAALDPAVGLGDPAPQTTITPGSWGWATASTLTVSLTVNDITFGLATASGDSLVYTAVNTSANVTELTASRTIYSTVAEAFGAPGESWGYTYRFVQTDSASVNLTDAANVTVNCRTTVPALGILNASARSSTILQSSVGGTFGSRTVGASFDLNGWADSQVTFTPTLGLVPLNLSGILSWSSSALASGSAAWNTTWSAVSHGWNGVSTSSGGSINGSWSRATEVTLFGSLVGPCLPGLGYLGRVGVILALSGPFDLYAGFLLVPHAFDLWAGFPCGIFGASLGSSWVVSDAVYFLPGRVTPWALVGENLVFGGTALFGNVFCGPWTFGLAFPFGGFPTPLPLIGIWGVGWGTFL